MLTSLAGALSDPSMVRQMARQKGSRSWRSLYSFDKPWPSAHGESLGKSMDGYTGMALNVG
jgi:hypothetical protein